MSTTQGSIQNGESAPKKKTSSGRGVTKFHFRDLEKLIELPDSLESQQAAKGRLLMIFSWLNIIVMTMLLMAVWIASPQQVIRPLIIVVSVDLLFLLLIYLVKRGRVSLASYLAVGILWLMVTLFALSGGGVDSPSYVGYFVVTFLAGILIGGPAVFVMTLICGFTGFVMVYLENIGRLPVAQYQHSPMTYWTGVFAFMLIVAYLQYYTSQVTKKALGQAQDELLERTRAENALRESNQRYQLISENSADVIWLMEVDTLKFSYISPSISNLLGHSPEEALAMDVGQFLPEAYATLITGQLTDRVRAFQEGDETSIIMVDQIEHARKDGTIVPVEMVTRLIPDPSGRVGQIVGVTRDITTRKKTENALRQKTRSLYMLSNCNQALVYNSDEHKLLQEMCRICVEDGGYLMAWVGFAENDPDKTVRPAAEFGFENGYLKSAQITWADTERGRGPTGMAIRSGQPYVIRDFLTDPHALPWRDAAIRRGYSSSIALPLIVDGTTIGAFMLYSRTPDAFDEDEMKLLVELSLDMSFGIKSVRGHAAQLELQEELIRSEARYRIAQHSAHIGSWEWDVPTNTMFWSDEMFDLFDKKIGEFTPSYQAMIDCIIPKNRLDAQEFVKNALREGQPFEEDFQIVVLGDRVKWLNIKGDVIHDESGTPILLAGTIQDVTELKTTQHALRQLNQDLEKRVAERTAEIKDLYDHAPTGYHSLDVHGKFQMMNATELKWFGYTAEEVIGKLGFADLVVPEEMEKFEKEFLLFRQRGYVDNLEFNLRRKDGSIMPVIINSTAILDQDGNFLHSRSNMIDNTERKMAQEELRQREEMYRALFENSNDGIFLFTPDGDSELRPNQRALDMIGYTAEEYLALSQNQRNIVAPPEEQQDADERLSALVNGEQVPLYERTFITKSGKRIDVEINLSPIRDKDGKVVLVQSVVRDVTERKQNELAIRASRDELGMLNAALEKASRMKDEFLSSMSHELRTPLTGILGLSDALQLEMYGTLNEKQLRSVKTIESSGRHLLELINDILDLSKIEAGKLELHLETISVAEICQSSLQMIKGMSHQKKQIVHYAVDPSAFQIRADGRRMKQMLVNLLSNAVKFTPEGGNLGLEVRGIRQEECICFTVWDEGIGINAEDMEKLFKPFVQLDSKLSRQYSGTGLGLSLVQRMAELHEGSVSLESTPGKGSRFTITLPWRNSDRTTEPAPEKNTASTLKDSLVIEDNGIDAEFVKHFLDEKGIKSIVHPMKKGALDQAAALRPSVILLDLTLSDGYGMDLLAEFKADERTRDIPVIITSVDSRKMEAYQLGASGYLVKPYSKFELFAELQKVTTVIQPAEPVMVITSSHLVAICDDNELNLEMISDFLTAKGFRVVTYDSGHMLLEELPGLRPDIILLDIQMPGMDGMEVMARLRKHEDLSLAATPVIAVTALAMSGDREKCLAAGANDYMSKPIALNHLTVRIHELIAKHDRG